MATREDQEDPKKASRSRPRTAEPDDDGEARERSRAEPLDEENPSICRGID